MPRVRRRTLTVIRRDELEETVLGGLRARLMDPVLYKAFAEAFTAEWNKLQGDAQADQSVRTAELRRVRQQIERLVDAIADGTPAAAVRGSARHIGTMAPGAGGRSNSGRHASTQTTSEPGGALSA